MASQMSTRSWNYMNKSGRFQRGFIESLCTTSHNWSSHPGRIRVYDQIWRRRRKDLPRNLSSCVFTSNNLPATSSTCRGEQSTTYIVCNHNLGSLDRGQHAYVSNLAPCGHCDILGDNSKSSHPGSLVGISNWSPPGSDPILSHARSLIDSDCDEDSHRSFLHESSSDNNQSNLQKLYKSTVSLGGYRSALLTSPNDANWIVIRAFHQSSRRYDLESKSKAEDTVKALKEEAKEKAKQSPILPLTSEPPKAVVPKKSLWKRFVLELRHYYSGFKLLFIDVKVCSRYLFDIIRGKSLTRRERRQLVRTTADLFRLVPFLVFIVVPFMEFLLPVALKLFPGMLPSTFSVEKKEKEKRRKNLKGKLEMAKFLQDTIEEMALQRKGGDESRVQEFKAFMKKVRSAGEGTTNEEIIKYSKIFKDEITLDSLNHNHLAALCKLLDLQPIGTNAFLRFQLRMKLRQLEADDRMIDTEGIDNLAVWELQDASRARGMRALGVPTNRLKQQLQQWMDLHLREKVPASLLLLSRALYLPPDIAPEQQLKATISVLPPDAAEEAKVAVSEVAGERIDNKAKLEVIKQEEQLIQEEREQSAKEQATEEANKKKVEEAKKKEEEVMKADMAEEAAVEAGIPQPASPEELAKTLGVKAEEILVDKATTPATKDDLVTEAEMREMQEKEAKAAKKEAKAVEKEEHHISTKELEDVEVVLEQMAEERMSLKLEQDELAALKEDVSGYKESLEDLKEVVVASGGQASDLQESKAAQRLSSRVNNMVDQLHSLVDDCHADKDVLTEKIEVGEVRIKRSKELQEDDNMRKKVLDQISLNKANLVGINELLLSMRRLQKVSDDTKIQRIMEVLDEDKDGKIDIDDALKVIELIGRENVKVSASKMSEIITLLRKEDLMEEEMKKKKEIEDSQKRENNNECKMKEDGPDPNPDEILRDPTDQQKKS